MATASSSLSIANDNNVLVILRHLNLAVHGHHCSSQIWIYTFRPTRMACWGGSKPNHCDPQLLEICKGQWKNRSTHHSSLSLPMTIVSLWYWDSSFKSMIIIAQAKSGSIPWGFEWLVEVEVEAKPTIVDVLVHCNCYGEDMAAPFQSSMSVVNNILLLLRRLWHSNAMIAQATLHPSLSGLVWLVEAEGRPTIATDR